MLIVEHNYYSHLSIHSFNGEQSLGYGDRFHIDDLFLMLHLKLCTFRWIKGNKLVYYNLQFTNFSIVSLSSSLCMLAHYH